MATEELDELSYFDDPRLLSTELRRLSHEKDQIKQSAAHKVQTKSKGTSLNVAKKEDILSKTNGVCHICGKKLNPKRFSITNSLLNGLQEVKLPSCKPCKIIHDNYLHEEIKWILKIGLWAKTQIEFETDLGSALAKEFIESEVHRENCRIEPRNPTTINMIEYSIKENHFLSPKTTFNTLSEILFWSYSNLAMAYNALDTTFYGRMHYILRRKIYEGLISKKTNIRSMFIDTKAKLYADKCCVYCGSVEHLQLDHIIPKNKGGSDAGENLVLACRKCNTSKSDTDLMEWHSKTMRFPPLHILRNYMKLIIQYCINKDLMDTALPISKELFLPFSVEHLPVTFPKPDNLFLGYYTEQ